MTGKNCHPMSVYQSNTNLQQHRDKCYMYLFQTILGFFTFKQQHKAIPISLFCGYHD